MSVLIRGLEMPDKCGHCRFATAFECEVTKNFITTFNVRQQDCPLRPVPPHGRLIDADALMTEVFAHDKLMKDGWNNMDMGMFTGNLMEVVANAPTIIPAEEE